MGQVSFFLVRIHFKRQILWNMCPHTGGTQSSGAGGGADEDAHADADEHAVPDEDADAGSIDRARFSNGGPISRGSSVNKFQHMAHSRFMITQWKIT